MILSLKSERTAQITVESVVQDRCVALDISSKLVLLINVVIIVTYKFNQGDEYDQLRCT